MLDQAEETPYTSVKVLPERTEDALASAMYFFASGNGKLKY